MANSKAESTTEVNHPPPQKKTVVLAVVLQSFTQLLFFENLIGCLARILADLDAANNGSDSLEFDDNDVDGVGDDLGDRPTSGKITL